MTKLKTRLLKDLPAKTTPITDFDYVINTNNGTTKLKVKDITKNIEQNVNKLNNDIKEILEKGTTVEVIERVTKEEIDRQIEDGTIANLTIEPGSITADRLDPNIELGVQIDDSQYSSDTTWSSKQMGNMLDAKLNSDVLDNILIYPTLLNDNTRVTPSFKNNIKFSWNNTTEDPNTHCTVVLDTSKYKGQSITISCEYIFKENDTLAKDSQIIITSAIDKTVSSYTVADHKKTWTRIEGVFPALTDGYCKYEKTLTIDNNQPYTRLAFMAYRLKAPTVINISLNVKINGVTVTPVAYGGFFVGDDVNVSVNIGGGSTVRPPSTGGGTPIQPPSTGDVDGISVDGSKVLLPEGYKLNEYLTYLSELIDNMNCNSNTNSGSNLLRGKLWAIMGDSISHQGLNARALYYKRIADRNPGLTYNSSQGISGSRVAKQSESDTAAMCYRYRNLAPNADIITVYGGVNDWGQPNPTPLGKFTDTTEVNNFYGALHSLCKNLIARYPKALILFITPMSNKGFNPFPNTDENSLGYTVLDYGNAIIEVCGNYGIPVFDLGKCGGMTPKIPEQNTLYYTDGLHLNDVGHERLSYLLERELLRYIQ